MHASGELQELDLAIPNMDGEEAEERAKEALAALPGIEAVRLISRGAWVRHDKSIDPEEICTALRRIGFRVGIFQDSAGRVGHSSQ